MENPNVRYRSKAGKDSSLLPKHYEQKNKSFSTNLLPVSINHFTSYLVLLLITFLLVIMYDKQLPTPLMIEDEPKYPGRFIAERAKRYVTNLTRMGPRPVGSFENEVLAVNYLSKEIDFIIKQANKIHRIVLDFQKVSGSYPLSFLDGMTNVYHNVQNVIVKIGPHKGSEHSLLVNCHFDSAIDSPGGSDDAASCAVMLETLRIISQKNEPLKHDLIFLFNGAEETFMQASHGFITQHDWSKNIRAFVNLEACGAGGKEILFQAGPEHPWLMQTYVDAALHPLASSLAQEIFESGLVPGDTDFRIFRDFGKVSGLDFAWSKNGYVYHTRLDDIHQIELGSLQNTGDNILPLLLQLVNSDYLSNIEAHSKGHLVFFDFIGIFIVLVKEYLATIINIVIIAASIYSVWYNKRHCYGISWKQYRSYLIRGVISIIVSWLVTLLMTIFLSVTVTSLNRCLSWFSRPIWLFFIYVIPTFLVPVIMARHFRKSIISPAVSQLSVYQIYCDSNICLFTTISTLLTICKVRSNFIVSVWLAFAFFHWFIKTQSKSYFKGYRQIWLYYLTMFIPFVLSSYIINGVSVFLIPIMGRSGSGNHAEIVLSMIMTIICALLFSFYAPLTLLVQDLHVFIKSLITIFVVSFLVLLFTPLGFPYSADIKSPAPQRYIVSHIERIFYSFDGTVRKSDSGIWIVNMDVNSPRIVENLIPEMTKAKPVINCDEELYCGMPYIAPVMTFLWDTHFVSTVRPVFPSDSYLNLTKRAEAMKDVQRLHFSVQGPDHMTLFISPYSEVKLKSWSFTHEKPLNGPSWKERSTYFVYYASGSGSHEWNFSIDLEVPHQRIGKPIVDIGFGGYFVHGAHQLSPQLKKFFSEFPPWTTTSGWISFYKSYTF